MSPAFQQALRRLFSWGKPKPRPLSSEGRAAVRELLGCINVDDGEAAQAQFAAFEAALRSPEHAELDAANGDALVWVLRDVTDMQSGYYVDWKDSDEFMLRINAMSERLGLRVDWQAPTQGEDFEGLQGLPVLLVQARLQLQAQGITLWAWDTEGDAYGGWMARSSDDERMRSIARQLSLTLDTADVML